MKSRTTAMWVLNVVLAIVFIMAGGSKLLGVDMQVEAFATWNLPTWFMYVTGALEVAGGIGLLVKQVRLWAALGLAVTMVGAIITHLLNNEASQIVVPIVLLLLSLLSAKMTMKLGKSMANTPAQTDTEQEG